jgi:NAD(P)-dependent dehydrogenase (short-subunit alcohol dehydrogenase family)
VRALVTGANGGLGITVNSILPGLIGTEKVRALPDEVLDRFRAGSGLLGTGRLGEPAEIAGLAPQLSDPKNARTSSTSSSGASSAAK